MDIRDGKYSARYSYKNHALPITKWLGKVFLYIDWDWLTHSFKNKSTLIGRIITVKNVAVENVF